MRSNRADAVADGPEHLGAVLDRLVHTVIAQLEGGAVRSLEQHQAETPTGHQLAVPRS
ncbi:hypothetical protein [Streptomyces lydicus]|uniref:hypothetical protein n=1 Tax=Streptomyces lydicus TaxID=47763 RepID=UPI0013E96307|nr:hypothetical protein [Streptomyces lydicus]MCZ1011886.1 hypothetical protein [Streptomyces lydicus]